ncbi:hypothetical protein [Rhodoferax sp.]|uniref:hypothetical protein n=1 Tax=Rhodoferax sp. TaxID=50421 RepID=UPI0025CCE9C2|nr:hypothetical protein [Rhodoferax sp.]
MRQPSTLSTAPQGEAAGWKTARVLSLRPFKTTAGMLVNSAGLVILLSRLAHWHAG